jgi:hypothetical protein
MARDWCLLQSPEDSTKLGAWADELGRRGVRPPELTWWMPQDDDVVSNFSFDVCNVFNPVVELVMFTPVLSGLHSELDNVVSL